MEWIIVDSGLGSEASSEIFFRETCRFSADAEQNDIPLATIYLKVFSKWKKVDIGGSMW